MRQNTVVLKPFPNFQPVESIGTEGADLGDPIYIYIYAHRRSGCMSMSVVVVIITFLSLVVVAVVILVINSSI